MLHEVYNLNILKFLISIVLVDHVSWILHRSREDKPPPTSEVLFGVNFVIRKIGEDIVIEGRARTLNDIIRLKRLAEEVLNEMIREYEGKRVSSTTSRYR